MTPVIESWQVVKLISNGIILKRMIHAKQLQFINDRIEKLNTAIFYNFSKSLLKFPVTIIYVTGFDENGDILFSVKKPYEDITDFDKEFPAQLKFYNKMYRFYVTVYGK